jgi:hypothetical protein
MAKNDLRVEVLAPFLSEQIHSLSTSLAKTTHRCGGFRSSLISRLQAEEVHIRNKITCCCHRLSR